MTVVNPPNTVPNAGRLPEDDLDGLLRAYFQAEMPDPWPSFEAPAPRNGFVPRRPQPRRLSLWHSRLALAASILLLIAGALFLLGGSTPNDVAAPANRVKGTPARGDRPPLPHIIVTPDGASLEQRMPLISPPMK